MKLHKYKYQTKTICPIFKHTPFKTNNHKMASKRHATPFINFVFICILISLLIPIATENVPRMFGDRVINDDKGRRLTREYDLRQGALRGLIVKPNRLYNLQSVEMFLGIPYAAPPLGNFRFMPPASAPSWPGVLMATRFAPVCPQTLPPTKKGDPPSLGRQRYMERLEPFLAHESEDCLYLNIYVPYREKKSKNFPVLVFIHGDSFEWSSGNPYDGRILASYGNIMVITINYRLGILGFLKPSMTEYVYNNNGILDQLAALQWIKDNIEDLNGDPNSVTLMGHGTGAACVSFLMLSPISNGLFHRAILMSGSALSDWALTKDPTQYTLQVAQSLGCNPKSEKLMACLQSKPLADIRKVQILAREFETPLGAVVAGAFIPDKPLKIMSSYPNLLSKYQLLCGVTEYEAYHDFGAIELEHGILETQRDELITKYANLLFEGGESVALTEILKQYSPSKMDPQRWSVETNRDVILNVFSDARTLSPLVRFANYHSKANRQCYFYVFGHNSVSTHYASLNKSVQGEELPYIFGVPLGGTHTHFHSEYTSKEKILSEAIMRLWTNFVKIGTPNTQSVNEYLNLDKRQWDQYNIEWPEYNIDHQSYLRLGIPPHISNLYRSNYSKFWIDYMPNKMKKFIHDPLYELTSFATTQIPKTAHKNQESVSTPRSNTFGRVKSFYQAERSPNTDAIYRKIQSIKTPLRTVAPSTRETVEVHVTTDKPISSGADIQVKTSSSTITLIVTLGILFLAVNIAVCAVLWIKKRRINLQDNNIQHSGHTCTVVEEVGAMRSKNCKEDINALQTLRNSCNAFKSMSIAKIRANHQKNKKRQDVCKTPKSDDSGGFKERFQLRRHLSTSTLDAHTKVRDWIANEVMHRCSPNMMHKIDSELDNRHTYVTGPFTRSEELLSDTKHSNCPQQRNSSQIIELIRNKTSEKTSTLALGSTQSTLSSKKKSYSSFRDAKKSTDSLKSIKSKGVSVAIDATPSARTNSILQQQPIELSKSFDGQKELKNKCDEGQSDDETITFTNEVTLSLIKEHSPVKVLHKHSNSDPVTNVNYEEISNKELVPNQFEANLLPSVVFRNEIKDNKNIDGEFSATSDALLTIKRRNFPKVLPDLPKLQKRLSLQTATLQTFRSYTDDNINSESDNLKIPPTPPPRTTTLDRRLDFKRSNQLSSFENSESFKTNQNYENIKVFTSNPILKSTLNTCKSIDFTKPFQKREYPKVIIASSNFPNVEDPKLLINTALNQVSNVPRVKVPDNFHSEEKDLFNEFLSNCSDDDDDDNLNIIDFGCNNDKEEDKLIIELVGGVSSSTHAEDTLDSKGPSRIFEKELEIIPVKVNTGYLKTREDYVCVTDLQLPDKNDFEKTAQIKPNYGINKLQQRGKSIQKPPEKAIKVVQKGFKKPSSILHRSIKNTKKGNSTNIITDQNEPESSNSGSSNDTEESTGTVKQNEIIKK